MSPRGKVKLDQPEVFKVVTEVGTIRFVVEEMPSRPGYVVARRRYLGSWQRKALGRMRLRDDRGAILPSAIDSVKVAVAGWYAEITGNAPEMPAIIGPFTIGETWAAISNPETGKYPHQSAFRDELQRALIFAVATWGHDTAWNGVTADHWTRLIRHRVSDLVAQGKTGLRATEITVSRILTALNWLKKTKRVDLTAGALSEDWRDELASYWKGLTGKASIPEPFRPRHTDEESRKLIEVSWQVDPRFGLMMALGAELRLGQVARARRSDLDLEANTFTVHGSGDKKGETINLTPGQRLAVDRALAGYLSAREGHATIDYYLFPEGRLLGKKAGKALAYVADSGSINPNTIRDWYWSAEKLAGVARVKGRGVYGVRRRAVDAALEENISEQGLKSLGGWSSGDMPRRVYAEQENKSGRKEAAQVRAKIRGESPSSMEGE